MPSSSGGKKKQNKKKSKGGKGGGSKTNKNNKSKQQQRPSSSSPDNFVSEAGPGCYIAHHPDAYSLITTTSSSSSSSNRKQHSFVSNKKTKKPNWMFGWEPFHPSDYTDDDDDIDDDENNAAMIDGIPDVAINPDNHILTACNTSCTDIKVFYVSVYSRDLIDANGHALQSVVTTISNDDDDNEDDENGIKASKEEEEEDKLSKSNTKKTTTKQCTTFIILCPPCTFAHLCQIKLTSSSTASILSWEDIQIESDVQPWSKHLQPEDEHTQSILFPLLTTTSPFHKQQQQNKYRREEEANIQPKYLCTQSEYGQLTHFFKGNLHAIDFRCNVNTPIVAVGNAVVKDVRDTEIVSGISVRNLFCWNSILLQLDDDDDDDDTHDNDCKKVDEKGSSSSSVKERKPLYVEYVHIQTNSAQVKIGDKVTKGQIIAYSGNIGFSPEPHLHFAAYRSFEDDASTVRVRFHRHDNADDSCKKDGYNEKEMTTKKKKEEEGKDVTFLPKAGCWYNENGLCSL